VSTLRSVLPIRRDQPLLRLVPTPQWEPPYEDAAQPAESSVGPPVALQTMGAVQGTLALTFLLPSGLPAIPEAPALRLVRTGDRAGREPAGDGLFDPQPTSSKDLPDPRFWAGRLAQAVLEVSAGVRPVAQLRRWTSDEIYGQLRRRSNRTRLVAIRDEDRRRPPRVVVRSVRVCEPADGIAEVCAVVHDGYRLRALALRLEGSDGRWRCTVLQHV
jgi:Family of unknown function (DUF6459)